MKKILFITSRADIGGGPKHLYDLVRGFEGKIEVYIASPAEKPYGEKFKEISTEWINIPHRKFSIISFIKLLYLCRERGIEVVHSHGRGAGIFSRLLKLWGFKVIHTFHGVHFENTVIGRIKVLTDKLFKNLTDTFISVSGDERQFAVECGVSYLYNTVVIVNGVDIKDVQSATPLDLSKYRDTDTVLFGTLARLCHQKGIDLLVEILSKKDLNKNWKFIVAGGGEDVDRLKKMIQTNKLENHVFLLGSISTPYSFLKSIDCYFSTSRGEGLPISVLEAMALGLPCILSNVIGHKTIANNEGEILLHNFDNFIEVCKIYKTLNPHNILGLCKKKYSIETMVEKTLSTY